MKKIALVVIVVVIGYIVLSRQNVSAPPSLPSTNQKTNTIVFSNPKKSAHWESNTPAHGATLAGAPVNVVIDVNFDLVKSSTVQILNDKKDYGVGETIIDTNKLAMRRAVDPAAPDGLYTVEYNACWPDGSCHDGSFAFAIDRNLVSSYEDLRGQKAVTLRMKNIAFAPQSIRISRGTVVTWVNDDSAVHYVNTDSHPAHTYEKDQNSKELAQGDSYRYTFTKPGAYPYHCSAHAESMTATIIVE